MKIKMNTPAGVMLDLETMGNGSNAAIMAIGAVRFDAAAGTIGDKFYRVVDLASSVESGGVIDASTVLWWMKQSDASRAEFAREGVHLAEALGEFNAWHLRGTEVWGNGSAFDNVILRNAYKSLSLTAPWHFRDDRCYRTVRAMFSDVYTPPFGTAHNAVNDAEYQARVLINIFAGQGEPK